MPNGNSSAACAGTAIRNAAPARAARSKVVMAVIRILGVIVDGDNGRGSTRGRDG